MLAECVTDVDFLSQVLSWKCKLPLQTIMRLLQVLVPQVEKICIDKYVFLFAHHTKSYIGCDSSDISPNVSLQGFDRWIRDLEVSPARHISGPAASSSPHPHPKVSGQRRHGHVVSHLHVGCRVFAVSQPRESWELCKQSSLHTY